MATSFPSSKQTIPNPSSTDLLENATAELDHDYQHATANDTIEALQDKVGADGSAVTTSHDYKLSEVTSTDKAVGKTATQTLENKTLTSPQINFGSDARGDMLVRNSSGDSARLPVGSNGQILSANASGDPEWIANPAAADASTTVKGVVEEATQAETLARTTAGATSARLFVNPSTLTTVQTYDYAASSAGSDTYAITVTPAPTAYVTGQVFRFKADVANTGACTLNVNSLGAVTIKKNVSDDLSTGDIAANQLVSVIYDGTNFQLLSAQQPRPLYATGATTKSINDTTDQTIAHGLGTTPKLIKITAMGGPSTNITALSIGTATSTTAEQSVNMETTTGSGNQAWQNSTAILEMRNSSDTVVRLANVKTLDSTNIVLEWTTNDNAGSSTLLVWEAYA